VTDLASAHVRALKHLERGGESIALNLGTGRGHSVREVVDMVAHISGRRVPVQFAPRRNGDPPKLVANADRAREVLGWQPRHSGLHSIVETAWRWHAEHRAMVAHPHAVSMSVGATAVPLSETAPQTA